MEDKSLHNSQQSQGISDSLQSFIDSMVEEIVLEGKPFDSQKKYLKKFSEYEGLDYFRLESDINMFFEILEDLKSEYNKLLVKYVEEKGKECNISEKTVQNLLKQITQPLQNQHNLGITSLSGAIGLREQEVRCALDQQEGLVRKLVVRNGKFGFTDETGRMVIPCQWIYAEPFSEGLALVQNNDKLYGFIDKKGVKIIPCKWHRATSFHEGRARVRKPYDNPDDERFGYIDCAGNVVIPCHWQKADYKFSEGLAGVIHVDDDSVYWGMHNYRLKENSAGYTAYINKEDKIVIKGEFNELGCFTHGMAIVSDKNVKFGVIDKMGNIVVPLDYDEAKILNENLIMVRKDHKEGVCHKNGKIILDCQWKIGDVKEGLISFCDDKNIGFIDENGEIVIPCKWGCCGENYFQDGMAPVRMDGKIGFINTSGDVVLPFQWYRCNGIGEGLIAVGDKNKMGYIDYNGDIVIPFQWSETYKFYDGRAIVGNYDVRDEFIGNERCRIIENSRYGFIDEIGSLITPCQWHLAYEFREGLAAVTDDKLRKGFIDRSGELVIPCKWKWDRWDGNYFENGLVKLKDTDGNSYIADRSGHIEQVDENVLCKLE